MAGVSHPVFDTYDAVRGVALRPGKRGWYTKEGSAYLEINSLGYRDVEHSPAKADGVIRIAFLGDSFTEARQVALDDTYWKQVERRLNADEQRANLRYESLGFGIGGYGTTQELLTLRLHALQFTPDLVVLAMFLGNDLAENSQRISAATDDSFRPFHVYRQGELVLDNSFRDPSLSFLKNGFLLTAIHYSRLLEVANQWRRDRQGRDRQQRYRRPAMLLGSYDEVYAPPADATWTEAWSITEDLVAQMHAEVTQAGARFVLVTLSTEAQVDPDPDRRATLQRTLGVDDLFYSEKRLRAFGAVRGVTVITLADRMQTEAESRKTYFHGFGNVAVGHGHWNVDGHTAAAAILAQELVAKGLVP